MIRKTSYKLAILAGLALYILGCLLFYPASHMATYTMFLAAIFAIAIGLSFLETAANTYSSMIGQRQHATLRLNISQTFYPVGALMGIVLGKYLVFQDGESLETQMANMTAAQAHAFRLSMLEHTLEPYKYLVMVLVVVMLLFMFTRYPRCKPQSNEKSLPTLGKPFAIWLKIAILNAVFWRSFCTSVCRWRCGPLPSVWRLRWERPMSARHPAL
ncbi:hypothetical protein WDV93_20160 [Pantoea ananatis]